jgi:carbonyl reductase 1
VARVLASEPHTRVVVATRDAAGGAALAAALCAPGCAPPVPLLLDTSSAASRNTAAWRLRDAGVSALDVLVNNAGAYAPGWSAAAFEANVGTNFRGPVALTLALAPLLAPGAAVINVSSGFGQLHWLAGSPYRDAVATAPSLEALHAIQFDAADAHMHACAPRLGARDDADRPAAYQLSKAMLNHATVLLAAAPPLAARGASVVAVDPGWVRTDMGGPEAHRSVEEGAEDILALVNHPAPRPSAAFYSGGAPAPW